MGNRGNGSRPSGLRSRLGLGVTDPGLGNGNNRNNRGGKSGRGDGNDG